MEESVIVSFRDFDVYKKSYACVLEIYAIAKRFPKEEMFALASQIKRASYSIPLNIAEGYGKSKGSNAEFKRFLYMSLGSADEMQVLIDMCHDLGYITKEMHDELLSKYAEISKMLQGLIKLRK